MRQTRLWSKIDANCRSYSPL